MIRAGSQSKGYTIVEMMIFLAVSAALFASAIALISGQQGRTEFSQAVYEVESQIQDIINDVATGYYTNTDNFTCNAPAVSGPPTTPSPASGQQGENISCVFVGRVIQFGVAGTDYKGFNVYTVVGRRQYGNPPREVVDFATAEPIIMNASINGDKKSLQNGLTIHSVKYSGFSTGAFGFVGSFGQPDPAAPSKLLSGDQVVNLLPLRNMGLNAPAPAPAVPNGTLLSSVANFSDLNPAGGVALCFNSGGTDQHAIITIGSNGRQLSTKTQIDTGSCT